MGGWQEEFRISDNPSEVDHDVVWRFLSTDAYWGRWRSRETLKAHTANAQGLYAEFGF